MPVAVRGETYYRTAEVYRMLGVCRTSLYRWLQKGVFGETEHRDARGWRLFTQEEVDIAMDKASQIFKYNRLLSKPRRNL
jgi:predicted site-specific integrase-resolvase